MNRRYQIIGKEDKEKLSEFLVRHGQFLLPMVELSRAVESCCRRGNRGVRSSVHRGSA